MPSKRNKTRQENRKKGGGEKAKSKSHDCCVTFKPQNSKFCFLRMPELHKLIFCNWIRRPRSVRPANGIVVSFSTTVTRKPLDKLQTAFLSKTFIKHCYYSFKIFPRFWLAKSTRIIYHNQLLKTKFGRNLTLTRKWRQKCSVFAG